jgi:hypothetical protein
VSSSQSNGWPNHKSHPSKIGAPILHGEFHVGGRKL